MDQDRTSVRKLREREYRMKREDAAARASGQISRKDVTLAAQFPELNQAPLKRLTDSLPIPHPSEEQS